jgi:hypothetical protein
VITLQAQLRNRVVVILVQTVSGVLRRTYMDAPVLPSRQSVMRKGEIAAVHSAFGCSFWLLALMECAWLAPRALTRT